MYFSLWHWAPLVNGYSGFIPKSYADFTKEVATFPDAVAIGALRRRGVTHVTINCGLGYTGCDTLRGLVRQSASLRVIAETQWRGQPVELYRVPARSGTSLGRHEARSSSNRFKTTWAGVGGCSRPVTRR
jgi:hypothetical protein